MVNFPFSKLFSTHCVTLLLKRGQLGADAIAPWDLEKQYKKKTVVGHLERVVVGEIDVT